MQDIIRKFHVLVVRISDHLTISITQTLEEKYGLPRSSDSVPNKALYVLSELQKRGVFSHDNVDPLIELLTSMDLNSIIKACGVIEYKEWAEHVGKFIPCIHACVYLSVIPYGIYIAGIFAGTNFGRIVCQLFVVLIFMSSPYGDRTHITDASTCRDRQYSTVKCSLVYIEVDPSSMHLHYICTGLAQ